MLQVNLQIIKDSSSHRIAKSHFVFPVNFPFFLSLPTPPLKTQKAKTHYVQTKKSPHTMTGENAISSVRVVNTKSNTDTIFL